MITFISIIAILGLNILAVKKDNGKENVFLLGVMSPVNIIFGFFLATESLERYQWVAGAAIVILGFYFAIMAIVVGVFKKGRK